MALFVEVNGRFRTLCDRYDVTITQNSDIKVSAELLRMAEVEAEGANNVLIDMPTRPELASRIGIAREGSANALWTNGGLMYSPPMR